LVSIKVENGKLIGYSFHGKNVRCSSIIDEIFDVVINVNPLEEIEIEHLFGVK